MLERKEISQRGEYKDIEKHEYKGVHFFTAIYNDHVVLEPVHEEILKALSDNDTDHERLWSDSAHSWARHMTLTKQRDTLITRAHDDIDYLMSGESLKEQRKEYLEKRKKLREQFEFFKEIRKG